ncbi:hypothetical protein VP1G_11378 [Cytospora mali]|uniref:Uncharacterized protein n=1 Tax=Cytospora mali TaxID=578113 RepID=A0A194VD73_CYTMA|nr:hypothetical protein VP1G_11378 [Valsa mali var. pyri (nom. inval.)]
MTGGGGHLFAFTNILPSALTYKSAGVHLRIVVPNLEHRLAFIIHPCAEHARTVVVLDDIRPTLDDAAIGIPDHHTFDPDHPAFSLARHHPPISRRLLEFSAGAGDGR